MKTRILLVISFLLVFVVTEINWGKFQEIKRQYNLGLVEPLSYMALGLFVSAVFLFLGSAETYRRWLRNIFLWYAPFSFLIIASGSTGSTYGWISRGDLAALMGTALVVVTAAFMLLQRFYFKHP